MVRCGLYRGCLIVCAVGGVYFPQRRQLKIKVQ